MNKKQNNNSNFNYSYAVFTGIAIVFLVIGSLFGMSFYKQRAEAQLQKFKNALEVLGSEVVPSVVSYGKVISINGRDVTMAFNEDTITIKIKDDAKIYVLESGSASGNREPYGFSDIKVGDMLKVDISIDSSGNFVGDSVIDFPQN